VIELEGVAVAAGSFALSGVSFAVPAGAYAVLMGRTGCGKTMLLEAIAGLRPVKAGRVRLTGRDVTAFRPADRGVGYVPQDLALFPPLTVREHLSFALDVRRVGRPAVRARVAELAGLLGLEPLLDRKPAGLSGGEAQRVALGRALAHRPAVLLLDEPLSALDAATKTSLVKLLREVRSASGATVLHVTHHVGEAEALADVRLMLADGRVVGDSAGAQSHRPAPAEGSAETGRL
jgi:molybdate/tungstate transport system ATP-binding protein